MKVDLFAILLMLTFVSHCISLEKKSCSATSSSFLRYMKRKDVKLLDAPIYDEDKKMCSGFWNFEGTCCDKSQFLRFADQDFNKLTRAIENSKKRIEIEIVKIRELFIKSAELENGSLIPSGLQAEINDAIKNEEIGGVFYFAADKTVLEKFKENHNSCWEFIRDTRRDLNCQFCKPTSPESTKVEKLTNAGWVCPGIYEKCVTSMSVFFYLIKAELLLSARVVRMEGIEKRAPELFTAASTTFIQTQPVFETISIIASQYVNHPSHGDKSGYLCFHLLGFLGDSFIEVLDSYVSSRNNFLDLLLDRLSDEESPAKFDAVSEESSTPAHSLQLHKKRLPLAPIAHKKVHQAVVFI